MGVIMGRFVLDESSLEICRTLAEATGLPFNKRAIERNAGRLITLYADDIKIAVAPRFSDVRLAEFSQLRINAYSSESDISSRPFVHVDQLFEIWAHFLIHLWSIRAIHELTGSNLEEFNKLVTWSLDIRDEPTTYRDTRDEMLHVFAQYGEAFRFAHDLTVGSMSFIVCHELAHHELDHLDQEPSPSLEFTADELGYTIMKEAFANPATMSTIRPRNFSMICPWIILQILDLSERRRAQRLGLRERARHSAHPLASDRIENILTLTRLDREPDVLHFWSGYEEAMLKIRSDLALENIE